MKTEIEKEEKKLDALTALQRIASIVQRLSDEDRKKVFTALTSLFEK